MLCGHCFQNLHIEGKYPFAAEDIELKETGTIQITAKCRNCGTKNRLSYAHTGVKTLDKAPTSHAKTPGNLQELPVKYD